MARKIAPVANYIKIFKPNNLLVMKRSDCHEPTGSRNDTGLRSLGGCNKNSHILNHLVT